MDTQRVGVGIELVAGLGHGWGSFLLVPGVGLVVDDCLNGGVVRLAGVGAGDGGLRMYTVEAVIDGDDIYLNGAV